MKVDLFDFDLPRDRIALRPASPRNSARLLQVRQDGLDDLHLGDLPGLLRPGDLLVCNDTRVVPARLRGKRGEAKIEVTLHAPAGKDCWKAFARPAKKLQPGDCVIFAEGFSALVAEKGVEGEVTLDFGGRGGSLLEALEKYGEMPLPPYIKRDPGADAQDRSDYQTMFARVPGAVAAPTAGLHFTPDLLQELARRGVGQVTVTLHVGAGTFLPVKVEDTEDHRMHAEQGSITAEAARRINDVKTSGGRIVAVGSTSLRLLESAADEQGRIQPFEGPTAIFITPGYRFRSVDLMMTNFHLPRSTLFMLVAAFSGIDRMRQAYDHAISQNYRFYSYGDACLLHRADLPA